ncbi:MAG: hypothetical protein QHC78_04800 [Pigmentiphaga sp.]|nr:hypothetical protein [Pigmentiphaga sp.]MDX3904989.1 hypothetical protein [Pigmentiphaga sp.]
MNLVRTLSATLAMAFLLAACGGGDDSPSAPGAEPPAQAKPDLRCAP